ncbi:hypothetical protein LCGC14_1669750, partial [marine sediment metagenome]
MKSELISYLNYLGLRIQGDIDGITCWRRPNGAIMWYLQAPPKKPPPSTPSSTPASKPTASPKADPTT